ncbi:MAG: respiratory nitrate reductase subunit gamma [Anaerolineae bacterium]
MPADRLTVFWVAIAVTLMLFLGLFALKVDFWSQGYLRDANGQLVPRRRAWAAFVMALRVVFSRQFFRVLWVFLLDGLLHRRLWQEDRFRWLAHFLMLFGFFSLFALSIITGFFEEILHFGFGIDTPLVRFVTDKDTPLMAVLNEGLGLMILVGALLAIIRRFIMRPAQLRTASTDVTTMVLLGIILLTGYPIEAFRLIMDGTPPALAWYSFLGYPLSLVLRPLNLNWALWHYWAFMVHIVACIVLALTMPFGKFFHTLVSPIIATVNVLTGHEEVRA